VEQPLDDDYREWMHWIETNPICDPALLFVAMDGAEIAGTVLGQAKGAEDPDAGWSFEGAGLKYQPMKKILKGL